MAQEWSYKFMGETVGPLSPSELRDHAIDGRVQPDSLVTRDGTDDWVSADRIKGLFDSDAGLLLKTEDTDEDGYEEATVVYENSTIYEESTHGDEGLRKARQTTHTKAKPSSWIVISTVVVGSVGMFWFCMGGGSEDEVAPSTTSIPDDVTYTVISEDIIPGTKRGLDIQLNKKVSEDVLRSIAMELKNADSNSYERTFIGYYLPDMTSGAGYWATTHFNPTLEVKILGLTSKQEGFLRQPTVDPSREIFGSWFDGRPNVGGKIVIFLQGPKTFMEITYKDGSSTITELSYKKSPLGLRFDDVKGSSFGDHWIAVPKGNLQLRDDEGLITTCKKIK